MTNDQIMTLYPPAAVYTRGGCTRASPARTGRRARQSGKLAGSGECSCGPTWKRAVFWSYCCATGVSPRAPNKERAASRSPSCASKSTRETRLMQAHGSCATEQTQWDRVPICPRARHATVRGVLCIAAFQDQLRCSLSTATTVCRGHITPRSPRPTRLLLLLVDSPRRTWVVRRPPPRRRT